VEIRARTPPEYGGVMASTHKREEPGQCLLGGGRGSLHARFYTGELRALSRECDSHPKTSVNFDRRRIRRSRKGKFMRARVSSQSFTNLR
jgi:hypothetical protein